MDYRQRYSDTPRLSALFLLGIDKDYIIRQHNWFAQEIENLPIQFHLGSCCKAETLESLAEIDLLVGHRVIRN